MSENTIKDVIDFLTGSREKEIKLQFFGGEPLLKFNAIKTSVVYFKQQAQKRKKTAKLLIATNGILLNDKIADYLTKNNFIVIFSFDGIREAQYLNRPPIRKENCEKIYALIEKNLMNFAKFEFDFFVNVVIGPDNLLTMDETVETLIHCGIRHIRLNYMMGVFWKKDAMERYFQNVEKWVLKGAVMSPSVEIRSCLDEPVLISSGLAVTDKKDLYVGPTLPLHRRFPSLKQVNHYGNIDSIKDINLLVRNRREEIKKALTLTWHNDQEFYLLANNLYMGICYQIFFKKLFRDHKELFTDQNPL